MKPALTFTEVKSCIILTESIDIHFNGTKIFNTIPTQSTVQAWQSNNIVHFFFFFFFFVQFGDKKVAKASHMMWMLVLMLNTVVTCSREATLMRRSRPVSEAGVYWKLKVWLRAEITIKLPLHRQWIRWFSFCPLKVLPKSLKGDITCFFVIFCYSNTVIMLDVYIIHSLSSKTCKNAPWKSGAELRGCIKSQ